MRASPPSLRSSDEGELIALAKSGGAQAGTAREELCNRYEPLVRGTVRTLPVPRQEHENAMQGGWLGLLEAFHRFDPGRGVVFGAYARNFVKRGILDAVYGGGSPYVRRARKRREGGGGGRGPRTQDDAFESTVKIMTTEYVEDIEDEPDGRSPDPTFDRVADEEEVAAARRVLSAATGNHGDLLRALFVKDISQAEIARSEGVSRAALSQRTSRALAAAQVKLEPTMTVAA